MTARKVLWGGRPGLFAVPWPEWQQSDLTLAQQEHRVEIQVVAEQTPVQAGGRAVAGNVLNDADDLAPVHRLAAPYGRPDR